MFWIRTTFYQFHNYCYYFIAIQFYLAKYVFSDIEINQPGGRFDILINYANLDSTVNNGDYCDWSLYRCDVYMIVNLYGLVGRESRLLLHWKTKTVANTARYAIKLSETIYENLPEKYRLELRVYDEDGLDENDLITNATGLFQPNTMNSFQIVPLNYYHSSNGFSLSSSIKLTCNSNYYGSSCDILCVPQEWEYKCDNNGRKICAPGRYGINCSMTDYCRISPCPKNTRCKNLPREHSYKCICKDYEGPECHSVYYSCENLPCKNGGHCALLSDIIEDDNAEKTIDSNQGKDYFDDETICICPDNWSGEFCTQQVTECIPENEIRVSLTRLTNRLCLNGGVCIIHPGNLSARCSCPPEWDGYFCELSKVS
ncbi:Neurogenic locus notch-like protein [Schistosoma japonicum]|uniref:Delta-like protein n=1 Tax=Schistosoma japonicum TaxID=6182 RepID=A0A4Z2DMS1_SCHJA|nr:Neurogenic locus notch-like protein [Schistosoma japonicum]